MLVYIYKNLIGEINLSDFILFFVCNLIIINTINSYFMKNPIYSLIFLILNYVIAGFLFFYSGFPFVGLIFMLIYVGAVSVLLVFTLMLLNLKSIYYKFEENFKFYNIIFFIFLIEFFYFILIINFYEISFFDSYIYIDWFKILFLKSDFVNVGYEIIIYNSDILVLIGLLLLIILVSSVNMIITLKDSKKQEKYSQVKNYSKNVVLNK